MIGNLFFALSFIGSIGVSNIGTNVGLQVKSLEDFETSVGVAKEIDFHLQSSLLPYLYNCIMYDYANGYNILHSGNVNDAYVYAYPSSYLYDSSYSFKINYNISETNNGYTVLALFPCWQIDRFYYTNADNEQVTLFDSYCHVKGGLTFTNARPSIVASGISVNPAFSHLSMTSWIAFPNSDNFVDWFNYDLDTLHNGYDGFANPTPIIFSGCNYGYYFTMETADFNSSNWSLDLTFSFFTPLVKNYSSNGYSVGYETGYNQGVKDGSDVGYTNGYNQGYQDGLTITSYSDLGKLFGVIADTPIMLLRSIFSFELFGMNVFVAIMSLLTGLVVLYIVRKIL